MKKRARKTYVQTRRYCLKRIPILRREWVRQFVKSNLFGGVGTIIHFAILLIFTEFFEVYYLISSGIGFIAGSSSNYFINKKYTFKENIRHKIFSKYCKYVLVSVLVLIINLGILFIFTEFV